MSVEILWQYDNTTPIITWHSTESRGISIRASVSHLDDEMSRMSSTLTAESQNVLWWNRSSECLAVSLHHCCYGLPASQPGRQAGNWENRLAAWWLPSIIVFQSVDKLNYYQSLLLNNSWIQTDVFAITF